MMAVVLFALVVHTKSDGSEVCSFIKKENVSDVKVKCPNIVREGF